ncbi:MAG: AEC family transporter [Gammaproteobacteria bacterium]|nr:AEC family transporter [Gammaproteobacteria bacterium]
MIIKVLSIIFPVFAIAGVGYLYGRYKRPDMTQVNQLNMDLFLPALIFSALASKSFDLTLYVDLALAGTAVVLGSGLLAWPFVRLLKVDYKTFIPPMMFNNSGNMGLPLALLAFGEKAVPVAVVLFIIEMVLHFTVGIYMLDRRINVFTLLKMPMIMSTILGLLVGGFGMPIWEPLSIMIKMIGDVAIPLLLFSLGVRLTGISYKDWHLGVAGAVISPATGLAMVWLISLVLELPPLQQSMLIIFGALPPAVLNFLVSEQYKQEPEKVASIVMLANLGSIVIMPFALAVALGF